jgi:hypothetical protein
MFNIIQNNEMIEQTKSQANKLRPMQDFQTNTMRNQRCFKHNVGKGMVVQIFGNDFLKQYVG